MQARHSSKLSQTQLNRSMNVSIAAGASGTLWVIVCSPQPIFNVFVSNAMNGGAPYLGLLVGILSLAALFQIPSIFIYSRLRRKKTFWLVTSTIHRLNGFVLAIAAFSVAAGGSQQHGLSIILIGMTASWIMTNISASGWWSWMAEIIPEKTRAHFFGRRSSVSNIVNIAWFFMVSVVLDAVSGRALFFTYGVVFVIGGIGGLADILLHVMIPEPRGQAPAADPDAILEKFSLKEFLEPLKNRNFIRFCLSIGVALFSINVSGPFLAPFITEHQGVAAPNTWLGIMFVISQLLWILLSPAWGMVMDRFGRKPVVMIGLLFTLSWIGYLFLSHANYTFILPLIALTGGVLAPAFWDGSNQLMLSLTPEKNRISYVSWYWAAIGIISAFGSFLGGLLDSYFRNVRLVLTGGLTLHGMQIVILISLVLILFSLVVLSRIKESRGKPVGYVFSLVTNPGVFRTFMNIGTISRTTESYRVARALRSIEGSTSNLALDEVLSRLQDPDSEVREEATRALGRIGAPEAFDALIKELSDPGSTVRSLAARALGRIGDRRALPYLISGMTDPSEDLNEACLYALGEIGGESAAEEILQVFSQIRSERLVATGAAAVSKMGILEAAWEIVPRMHRTRNSVLRNQLAIALGNLLGKPGEFYQYVTGGAAQRQIRCARLLQDAIRNLPNVVTSTRLSQKEAETRRESITEDLRQIRVLLESEMHVQALELCNTIGDSLGSMALPDGTPRDLYLEYAVFINPKFGLWLWFVREARQAAGTVEENAVLRIDVLLVLYFLSTFRMADRDQQEGTLS